MPRGKGAERRKKVAHHWRKVGLEEAVIRRSRQYGLLPDEAVAILRRQDYRCAICRHWERDLVFDHDHKSGEFRGFLCNQCNIGLGLFRDKPTKMAQAVFYLTNQDI